MDTNIDIHIYWCEYLYEQFQKTDKTKVFSTIDYLKDMPKTDIIIPLFLDKLHKSEYHVIAMNYTLDRYTDNTMGSLKLLCNQGKDETPFENTNQALECMVDQIYDFANSISTTPLNKDYPISNELQEKMKDTLLYTYVIQNEDLAPSPKDGAQASEVYIIRFFYLKKL